MPSWQGRVFGSQKRLVQSCMTRLQHGLKAEHQAIAEQMVNLQPHMVLLDILSASNRMWIALLKPLSVLGNSTACKATC